MNFMKTQLSIKQPNTTMKEVVISFLKKEEATEKDEFTYCESDGEKLFCNNTCIGQWIGHSVLINNTYYKDSTLDKIINKLQKEAKDSGLIYKFCSKKTPFNVADLKQFV